LPLARACQQIDKEQHCRRKLIEAALLDPSAIVFFATDEAKIDFANLRPLTKEKSRKLGATPGTLFAPKGTA
jgi:hypothetical protein